jgi:pyruvate ferredoxin oxidoreductase gamma subunit
MHKLKLYGLGGQGVVTASTILATAVSIYENRYAKSLPAYGHERRGAPVFADVMVDSQPILLNTFVYDPDYVLLFDPSVVEKGVDIEQGIDEGTVLIVNINKAGALAWISQGRIWKEIYHVNASHIAQNAFGRDIPNSAMLGALATTGLVKIESVCRALEETFKRKDGDANVQAAREAYRQTQKA